MKNVLDLSHWNKIISFKEINKFDLVIHKGTQGTKYLDPTYKYRKKNITTEFGSYHFAEGKDPIKEANWYLKNCKDNFLVLDWEIEHPDPIGWSNKFLDRIKEKTGVIPYWYSNDARAIKYADKIPYPKWIARYGINNGTKSKEPKYNNWDIWQYTSRGKVKGIYGNVDLSIAKKIIKKETMSKNLMKALSKLVKRDLGAKLNKNEEKEVIKMFESMSNLTSKVKNQADVINVLTKKNEALRTQLLEKNALAEKNLKAVKIITLLKEILNKIINWK